MIKQQQNKKIRWTECECDSIEKKTTMYLFSCYMQKLREWFALLFTLLVVPILAHTCWVCTFSCLSWERTVHYTIMLIPTVFLPYTLVSNFYLVTIFFIRIICEKFEFTSYTHSWSFTNIIVLCRLGSVHVVFFNCLTWVRVFTRMVSDNPWCSLLVPSSQSWTSKITIIFSCLHIHERTSLTEPDFQKKKF